MPSSTAVSLSIRNTLTLVLGLPLMAGIVIAIAIAGMSAMENIRYTRARQQIVDIAEKARTYAATEKTFAQQPGEDLLVPLIRAGIITNAIIDDKGQSTRLLNAWEGEIKLSTYAASVIRIETIAPAHNCRRLSLVFLKNAKTLNIRAMAARESNGALWRQFYNGTPTANDAKAIEAACGRQPLSTLALYAQIR